MFIHSRKPGRGKTLQEQKIDQLTADNQTLSEDLMATQETAALLYEENAAKDEQIADMEDMIAQLYEGGAALV